MKDGETNEVKEGIMRGREEGERGKMEREKK